MICLVTGSILCSTFYYVQSIILHESRIAYAEVSCDVDTAL